MFITSPPAGGPERMTLRSPVEGTPWEREGRGARGLGEEDELLQVPGRGSGKWQQPPASNLISHICLNSCALPPKRMRLTDRREWRHKQNPNIPWAPLCARHRISILILQQPYEVGFKVITYRGLATLHLTWFLDLDLKPGSAMYCDVEACDTAIFLKKTTEYWQCHIVQLNIAWSLNFFKPVSASLKWR